MKHPLVTKVSQKDLASDLPTERQTDKTTSPEIQGCIQNNFCIDHKPSRVYILSCTHVLIHSSLALFCLVYLHFRSWTSSRGDIQWGHFDLFWFNFLIGIPFKPNPNWPTCLPNCFLRIFIVSFLYFFSFFYFFPLLPFGSDIWFHDKACCRLYRKW